MRTVRRNFLKTAVAMGVGWLAPPSGGTAGEGNQRADGTDSQRAGTDSRGGMPAIRERAVYLNIGHSISPLTVNEWPERRWHAYLDALIAARFNSIHFHIWQDYLSDFAAAATDKERNRKLHENLQQLIRLAHRRGMHTALYLTPTFGPHGVWQQHPDLVADIDYVRHGFLSLCPSREGAGPLMREFVAHELAWFTEIDAVQVWFYDPGGCLCAACRSDLTGPLVRQVEMCRELIRTSCPRAELRVSLWPIWAWEAHLQQKYGTALLDRLAALSEEMRPKAVFDTAQRADSFLAYARERGFATHAFFFSANVESPFAFFNPHFEFFRVTAQQVAAAGHDGAVIHSIEAGAKWLDTFIGGLCLWSPQTSVEELSTAASQFATGDRASAEILAPALVQWHDRLREGTTGDGFTSVRTQVEKAVALLPETRRQELEWLTTSARAIDIIAQAARDDAVPATAKEQLQEVLTASPTFRGYTGHGIAALPQLTRFVRRGWDAEHF